jgi:hypothetical protein
MEKTLEEIQTKITKNPDWEEVKSKIKKRWNKLNDLELDSLQNDLNQLGNKLMLRYGFSDDFAKSESTKFFKGLEREIKESVPNLMHMVNNAVTRDRKEEW